MENAPHLGVAETNQIHREIYHGQQAQITNKHRRRRQPVARTQRRTRRRPALGVSLGCFWSTPENLQFLGVSHTIDFSEIQRSPPDTCKKKPVNTGSFSRMFEPSTSSTVVFSVFSQWNCELPPSCSGRLGKVKNNIWIHSLKLTTKAPGRYRSGPKMKG